MSRLIADMLDAKQPDFTHRIEKWESLTGHPKVDIRISAKLRDRSRLAIAKLGLDREDTSARELYQALKHRLSSDNRRISKMLKIDLDISADEMSARIVEHIEGKIKMPQVWQLRGAFIKKAIRKNPPKLLMKHGGYRSVDSLLKRGNLAETIALGRELDPRWYARLCELYQQAQPSDLEQKNAAVILLTPAKLAKISQKAKVPQGRVATVNELGSIVIFPNSQRFEADVISMIVILIEGLREIKLVSSLLKFLTVRKDFGRLAAAVVKTGSKASNKFFPLGWSSICHFAYKNRILPEFTQPHISQDDLDIMPVSTEFCIAFPELNYWFDLEHLGHHASGGVVSFNLIDIVLNTSNMVAFENRSTDFMQRQLWDELHSQYLIFPQLQAELLGFKR